MADPLLTQLILAQNKAYKEQNPLLSGATNIMGASAPMDYKMSPLERVLTGILQGSAAGIMRSVGEPQVKEQQRALQESLGQYLAAEPTQRQELLKTAPSEMAPIANAYEVQQQINAQKLANELSKIKATEEIRADYSLRKPVLAYTGTGVPGERQPVWVTPGTTETTPIGSPYTPVPPASAGDEVSQEEAANVLAQWKEKTGYPGDLVVSKRPTSRFVSDQINMMTRWQEANKGDATPDVAQQEVNKSILLQRGFPPEQAEQYKTLSRNNMENLFKGQSFQAQQEGAATRQAFAEEKFGAQQENAATRQAFAERKFGAQQEKTAAQQALAEERFKLQKQKFNIQNEMVPQVEAALEIAEELRTQGLPDTNLTVAKEGMLRKDLNAFLAKLRLDGLKRQAKQAPVSEETQQQNVKLMEVYGLPDDTIQQFKAAPLEVIKLAIGAAPSVRNVTTPEGETQAAVINKKGEIVGTVGAPKPAERRISSDELGWRVAALQSLAPTMNKDQATAIASSDKAYTREASRLSALSKTAVREIVTPQVIETNMAILESTGVPLEAREALANQSTSNLIKAIKIFQQVKAQKNKDESLLLQRDKAEIRGKQFNLTLAQSAVPGYEPIEEDKWPAKKLGMEFARRAELVEQFMQSAKAFQRINKDAWTGTDADAAATHYNMMFAKLKEINNTGKALTKTEVPMVKSLLDETPAENWREYLTRNAFDRNNRIVITMKALRDSIDSEASRLGLRKVTTSKTRASSAVYPNIDGMSIEELKAFINSKGTSLGR